MKLANTGLFLGKIRVHYWGRWWTDPEPFFQSIIRISPGQSIQSPLSATMQ